MCRNGVCAFQEARKEGFRETMRRVASFVATKTGSPYASLTAVWLILMWLICGPLMGFSDTWQLYANTFTTLITFVMMFLIQLVQNRDNVAIHLKLKEIIYAMTTANNDVADVENLTEHEFTEIMEGVVPHDE